MVLLIHLLKLRRPLILLSVLRYSLPNWGTALVAELPLQLLVSVLLGVLPPLAVLVFAGLRRRHVWRYGLLHQGVCEVEQRQHGLILSRSF